MISPDSTPQVYNPVKAVSAGLPSFHVHFGAPIFHFRSRPHSLRPLAASYIYIALTFPQAISALSRTIVPVEESRLLRVLARLCSISNSLTFQLQIYLALSFRNQRD